MKILVVGGGGREHALVWKIAQSPKVKKIYAAPGNPGISILAECVESFPLDQLSLLADFAKEKEIDLTVVGPEAPLIAGLADELEEKGLKVFGPNKLAAILEGSKSFAKQLMKQYGIPTPSFRIFSSFEEASTYVKKKGTPLVVKADGLAGGKGAIVAREEDEALEALDLILVKRAFGEAGRQVVIEDFCEGEEVSILAFTDGEEVLPLIPCQDHKRVYDGDKGPNTGGMGAYAPVPFVTDRMIAEIERLILRPIVRAMKSESRPYRGLLYAGLMITNEGPKVLEFNCRFGDPETQAILPLLESDLVEVMEACCDGHLEGIELKWRNGAVVCVVLASGGYPGKYEIGLEVTGLKQASSLKDVIIFHAGTSWKEGKLVTAGGRVLGITGWGKDLPKAIAQTYEAINLVNFPGKHFRKDIGKKGGSVK